MKLLSPLLAHGLSTWSRLCRGVPCGRPRARTRRAPTQTGKPGLLAVAAALLLGAAPLLRAIEPRPTTLTCEHMDMWSEGDETKAICTGKVTLTGTNLQLLCDRLELTATRIGERSAALPTLEKFRYLLATGHVSITQGSRGATCGRAEVFPREDKVVLTEDPVVVDRATDFVSAGDRITMLRGQERVEVDNPRLTGPAIKDLGFDRGKPAAPADAPATPPPAK